MFFKNYYIHEKKKMLQNASRALDQYRKVVALPRNIKLIEKDYNDQKARENTRYG